MFVTRFLSLYTYYASWVELSVSVFTSHERQHFFNSVFFLSTKWNILSIFIRQMIRTESAVQLRLFAWCAECSFFLLFDTHVKWHNNGKKSTEICMKIVSRSYRKHHRIFAHIEAGWIYQICSKGERERCGEYEKHRSLVKPGKWWAEMNAQKVWVNFLTA